MTLDAKQVKDVGRTGLFANSVCLFIVTSAQNRAELENQLEVGKSIKFVRGKLAMMVMSNHALDISNVTKVSFPVMVLEPNRHNPRDNTQFRAYLWQKGLSYLKEFTFSYGERPFCFITGGQRNPISFKEVRGAAAVAQLPPVHLLPSCEVAAV